jgi:hypothetical protein
MASTTDASGTLLCSPAQAQIDACAGAAAGDACTLSTADAGTTVAGTCRATLDGTAVACAPNPHAPPQELVDACTGKVVGDACSAAEPFDDHDRAGVCITARDGVTVVCGRVHTPSQAAADACANAAAGDACTLPDDSGRGTGTAGVCSLGPASTGPLACTRAQELLPHGEDACAGLAAGDACTLGRGHGTSAGTCVTPAEGGGAVCVVACANLGGLFKCDGNQEHGDGEDHHPGDDDQDGHHPHPLPGDGGVPPTATDGGVVAQHP